MLRVFLIKLAPVTGSLGLKNFTLLVLKRGNLSLFGSNLSLENADVTLLPCCEVLFVSLQLFNSCFKLLHFLFNLHIISLRRVNWRNRGSSLFLVFLFVCLFDFLHRCSLNRFLDFLDWLDWLLSNHFYFLLCLLLLLNRSGRFRLLLDSGGHRAISLTS